MPWRKRRYKLIAMRSIACLGIDRHVYFRIVMFNLGIDQSTKNHLWGHHTPVSCLDGMCVVSLVSYRIENQVTLGKELSSVTH